MVRQSALLFVCYSLIIWGRLSATNGARMYNECLPKPDSHPENCAFSFNVRTEQVWDGVILFCLLEDAERQGFSLQLPHTGEQRDRLTSVVRTRNDRFERDGQPELTHYCEKCVRFYEDGDGFLAFKLRVIVIDGVTIGRPCCGVLHCTGRLESNCNRFCTGHQYVDHLCSIVGCNMAVVPGRKTCVDPEHQKLEDQRQRRNKALFQMKNIQRRKIAPRHGAETPYPCPEDLENQLDCPDKPDVGIKKAKAQFGRRQTHNEQLAVSPCGIVLGRRTFYGSETTPQVAVSCSLDPVRLSDTVPCRR